MSGQYLKCRLYNTVLCWLLIGPTGTKPNDDPERDQFLFSLLHSPPSAHGIN